MFASLGAALDGASAERHRTSIRRHSHLKGRSEGLFWRRMDRQEVGKITLAAHRYELATRQPGARNGALGHVALELLALFANLIDRRNGRLDPSLDYLMAKVKRSRDAIVRALKALREHGFLDWLRRYVATGNEGRGPQVQQTSNAYRLSLPQRALQLLGRLAHPAPLPDDVTHARQQRTAELDAHKAALPCGQRVLFDWMGDDAMGAVLARLGDAIEAKQRESASRSESQTKVLR